MQVFKIKPFENCTEQWFQKQRLQHLYVSYNWLSVLNDTYNFEICIITDTEETYVAPFCKVDDLVGKRLISLPFSDHSLLLHSTADLIQDLFLFLSNEYPTFKIELKLPHLCTPSAKQLIYREAVYHQIALQNESFHFHKSFLRGQKKAVRNGVKTRVKKTKEALQKFYELYHALRLNKFKSIAQPFSFFENIYNQFIAADQGFIYEAFFEDRVIASVIVLVHSKTAFYKFGCSDEAFLEKNPNNVLFYNLIHILKDSGYEQLDLGLSGVTENYAGLRRWKQHMGGVEFPINYINQKAQIPQNEQKIAGYKENIQTRVQQLIQTKPSIAEVNTVSEEIYSFFA